MFNPHEQEPKFNKGKNHQNVVPENQSSTVQQSLSKNFEGNKFFNPLCTDIKTTSTHSIDTNNGKKIVSTSEVFEDERTLTKNEEVKKMKRKKIKADIVNWQSQNERVIKKEENLEQNKRHKIEAQGSDFEHDDDEESLTQTILQCQKEQEEKLMARQAQQRSLKQEQLLQQQSKEREREHKIRSKITLEHNLTYDSQNNPQALAIFLRFEINKCGENQETIFSTKIQSKNISLCLGLLFNYDLLQIEKAFKNGEYKVSFCFFNHKEIAQIEFTKNNENINLEFGGNRTMPLIPIVILKKEKLNKTNRKLENTLSIPNKANNENIEARNKQQNRPKMGTDQAYGDGSSILIDEESSDSSEQITEERSKKEQSGDQAKLSRAQENEEKMKKLYGQVQDLENRMSEMKNYKENEKQRIKQALQVAIREKEQERRIIREQQKKQKQEKIAKQKGQKKLEAERFEAQYKKSTKILESCQALFKKVSDLETSTYNKSNQIISREIDKLSAVYQRLSTVQSEMAEIKKWSQEVERYLTLDLKNQISTIYNEFQRHRTYDRNGGMGRKSPMVRNQYPNYANNNYHNYQQPRQNIYQKLENQIRVRGVEDWQKQNEKQKMRERERQRQIEKQKRLKQVDKDGYSSYNSYENLNNYGVAKTQFCDNLAEAQNIIIRDLRILDGKSFPEFDKKRDNSDEDNISEQEVIRKARINQRNQYRKFDDDEDDEDIYRRSRSRSATPYSVKDKARELKLKRIQEQKKEEQLQRQKQKQMNRQKKRQIERQKQKQRLEQAAQERQKQKQRQRKIEFERQKRFGRSPEFKRDSYSPVQARKYRKQSQQQEKIKIVWHLFPSISLETPETNIPVMVHRNFKGFDIDDQKIKYSNAKNDWGQIIGGPIAFQNTQNVPTVKFQVLKTMYINANFGIGIVNDIPPLNAPVLKKLNAEGEKKYFEHSIFYNSGNCQLWKIERANKQICVTKGNGLKAGDIMSMIVNLQKGQIVWKINDAQVGRISHKIMMNRHYEWKRFLLMKNDGDEIVMI